MEWRPAADFIPESVEPEAHDSSLGFDPIGTDSCYLIVEESKRIKFVPRPGARWKPFPTTASGHTVHRPKRKVEVPIPHPLKT